MRYKGTIFCTVSGTMLSVAESISASDVLKSCLLAAAGATVSFLVTQLLGACFKRRK